MRDSAKVVAFGEYALDFGRGELRQGGIPVDLQPMPMRVLLYLAEHRDRIVSRRELLDTLWPGVVVGDESLTVALAEARYAVGDDGTAQRVIRTHKRRGYRFVAEVRVADDGADGAGAEAEESVRRGRKRLWLAGASSALGLGAIAAAIWWRSTALPPLPEFMDFSVAVLPVENLSGSPQDQVLADGLTEQITHALAEKQLPVVARTTAAQWRDRPDDVRAIGERLGISHVLEGSVRRDGERLRVTMQLVETRTGTHVWSEVFEDSGGDLFALQDRVTARVGHQVYPIAWYLVPKGEVHPRWLRGIADYNAMRRAFSERRWMDVILLNERLLAQIPKREPYLAGRATFLAHISWSWANLYVLESTPFSEAGPKLLAAAEQAVEEWPGDPDARNALSRAYAHHWRWSEAEREMRATCDLGHPEPCGPILVWTCAALGCVEDQLKGARLFASRVGTADGLGDWLARALLNNDRLEEAEAASLRAQAIDPSFPPILLSHIQWRLGRRTEAIEGFRKWLSAAGDVEAARELGRRSAQSPEAALRWLADQQAGASAGKVAPNMNDFLAALVYADLGDHEAAIGALEHSVAEHEPGMELFCLDPTFDPLRDTPRFRTLIEKMGLTAYHEKYGVFERARRRTAALRDAET